MKRYWLTYLGLWLLVASLFPGLAGIIAHHPDMHMGQHMSILLAGALMALGIPRGPMSR